MDRKDNVRKQKIARKKSGNNRKTDVIKQIIGLILYILIFVVIVPVNLYKLKLFTLLEGYLPNIDLLATCLSWYGGPSGIWTELYPDTVTTLYGFLSKSLINYGALLGVTYIIAREANLTKNEGERK